MELKYGSHYCTRWNLEVYQSYQSGIEMINVSMFIVMLSACINRTKVELKCVTNAGFVRPIRYQSYQSGIEILFTALSLFMAAMYQSYQSGIEMGIRFRYFQGNQVRINRTKVELKYRKNNINHFSKGVSIVPKWNWNILAWLRCRNRSRVSIVPKWNWNMDTALCQARLFQYQSYQSGIEIR